MHQRPTTARQRLGARQCRAAFSNPTFVLLSLVSLASQAAQPLSEDEAPAETSSSQPWFLFDRADEIVRETLLESPLFYDAGIAPASNGLWLAWLEFQPGKGDQLWIGLRGKAGWSQKKQLTQTPGDYANPTPTVDAQGQLWLTYETTNAQGNWQVCARLQTAKGEFQLPIIVCSGPGPNICHRAVPDTKTGICVAWQGGPGAEFATCARRVTADGMTIPVSFGSTPLNSWAPSVAVTPDGVMHLVWDAYDGASYNVWSQSFQPGTPDPNLENALKEPTPPLPLAASPNFEAHAQIALGRDGKLWVLWEEDGQNWGKRYIARKPLDKKSTKMSDKVGPLHRFRRLHLAQLNEQEKTLTEYEIPQPSFDLARARTNAPPDLKDFGAFYERGQLVVDGQNRPWVVYRHFYVPWMGVVIATHKRENMRIYARCLLPDGWSKLYSFKDGQGDGGQRISAAPLSHGVAIAWTTGRTDRRKTKDAHGVAFAQITAPELKPVLATTSQIRELNPMDAPPAVKPRQRPSTDLAGKHYELWYGDLHRHTDISLCFSPVDGTIDDAYRYAIDAAPLDFLGITDHTHDLQMGEPLAHIWWRSRKEVNRHLLGSTFIPFYSYERSRGDTDHNVISLRDDMLRPHTYPLPQFWKELDTNTITIPHQPFNPVLWKNKDDVHRTLLEIYQGMRNNIEEADAQEGLRGGHHFGIISSSDHLSTGASFACVWSDKPTRESIFRSMQARRTFGATAKIVLKVTAGEHWMGEIFSASTMPPIQIEAQGTAPIEQVDILVDGKVAKSFKCEGAEANLIYRPEPSLKGSHIFFVRLQQTDGNHAWSSPMWVEAN